MMLHQVDIEVHSLLSGLKNLIVPAVMKVDISRCLGQSVTAQAL